MEKIEDRLVGLYPKGGTKLIFLFVDFESSFPQRETSQRDEQQPPESKTQKYGLLKASA